MERGNGQQVIHISNAAPVRAIAFIDLSNLLSSTVLRIVVQYTVALLNPSNYSAGAPEIHNSAQIASLDLQRLQIFFYFVVRRREGTGGCATTSRSQVATSLEAK